jgi:hypothetical protein
MAARTVAQTATKGISHLEQTVFQVYSASKNPVKDKILTIGKGILANIRLRETSLDRVATCEGRYFGQGWRMAY